MIRPAKIEDIESVVEIYNQAIDAPFQTAFTDRMSVADRADWFNSHLCSAYPMFVYEADGKVVGWLTISSYRSGRGALRYTVEVSYYLHNAYQRKGIGTQLLDYGLDACRQLKYRTALAILLEKNVASIRLLEKAGFRKWAELPAIADFDGQECGHVYYGLKFTH